MEALKITNESLTKYQKQALVKAALQTPTGDNCQSFAFKWNGDELEIYHDESRAAHALNHQDMASLISLGSMLEALQIAAHHMGWDYTHELMLEKEQSYSLWARLAFYQSKKRRSFELSLLEERTTDRFPYKKTMITVESLQQMWKHPRLSRGWFYFVPNDRDIEQITVNAEDFIWDNPSVYMDILKWIRLGKRETKIHNDGMPSSTLGMNFMETQLFRLIRRYPRALYWLRILFAKKLMHHKTRQLLRNSSGLVIFTDNEMKPEAFINAGRRCFHFWIKLCENSMVAQPLSIVPFGICLHKLEAPTINFRFQQVFQAAHDQFAKKLDWSEKERPLWLFRIGYPTLSPTPRASRRLVEDVMLDNKSATGHHVL